MNDLAATNREERQDEAVRITMLTGIEAVIHKYGGNPTEILAKFDIDPDYLENPNVQIPFGNKVKFFEYCADTLGQPFFGLELGRIQKLDTVGPLVTAIRTSATAGAAIATLNRFLPFVTPAISAWTEKDLKTITQNVGIAPVSCRDSQQINDQVAVLMIRTINDIVADKFPLLAIEFPYRRASAQLEKLAQFFGCEVRQGAENLKLRYPSEIAEVPLVSRDAQLNSLIKKQLSDRLDGFSTPVEASVNRLIGQLLPTGDCCLSNIASILGKHERSLQKELQAIGKEFRQILGVKRQELATDYLTNSEVPLCEISELLGYSDQAAFTRAFTKHNGVSPLRYRKMESVIVRERRSQVAA